MYWFLFCGRANETSESLSLRTKHKLKQNKMPGHRVMQPTKALTRVFVSLFQGLLWFAVSYNNNLKLKYKGLGIRGSLVGRTLLCPQDSCNEFPFHMAPNEVDLSLCVVGGT